ncbi:MAG: HAMP domain-containing sensor histidine kinase [Actinomycetota bacterium]|nr:HAMP domain-containing sensor histidine kinase [Actinomycetota bacterium]
MDTSARSRWLRPAVEVLSGLPRWPMVALVFLSVCGVVWLLAPRSVGEPLSFVAIFVGAIVAGLTFIRRSRLLAGRERRAWTLVGWGFTVGSFGMIALGVTAAAQGEVRAFGPADLVFILGYLGVLVGFASLPHTAGTRLVRVRTGLDGLIGAVAVGALLLTFALETVVAGVADAPMWESVVGIAYPLVDLGALVVFMIVTVRQSMLRFDLRIMLLAIGILAQAVADIQFLVTGVGNSLAEAQPPQLLYMFAIGCYVATAAIVDRVPEAREYADRRPPLWALIAPYGAAAAMVVVLVTRLWDANLDQGDRVLLVASLVVAALVIGRQGIAIRENRKIVEQQRSDLVSSISHELRTPLTAMVGFVAVLQEDPKLHLDERVEMIDVVAEQGSYLERIVEDLLILAHDDPNRVGLTTAEHAIEPIVRRAVLSAGCEPPYATIEVEPGLTAVVDGGRIVQILVNLLSNAQRYGGDTCLIVARAEGTRLIIEVHDSGPGVPKKYELVIWERFERGPNRFNASIPGSGIGLAMVHTIAEAHGGRVGYRQSERLDGACFSLDLPGIVGEIEPRVMAPSTTLAIG